MYTKKVAPHKATPNINPFKLFIINIKNPPFVSDHKTLNEY